MNSERQLFINVFIYVYKKNYVKKGKKIAIIYSFIRIVVFLLLLFCLFFFFSYFHLFFF